MIIVKLKGGLGNQLFQYAVGRHLAKIHKSVLKIDISLFETYKLHAYSLQPFNIQEVIASSDEVLALAARKIGIVERTAARLLRKSHKISTTYIQEKHFHFDPEILNLPDGVYLDGYWQSEKYFAGIAEIIRQEFTIKTLLAGKNKDLAERMALCESVSLHIRRGTYLFPVHNAFHGTCPLDYCFSCVEYFVHAVKQPHFFIFSDDLQWVRDNLKLPYPTTYVDHNDAGKDYEDLRLMSLCKHHIIANSTFSWWAAWLNTNPEKIVCAPGKWFNDPKMNTNDLISESWIKV